MTLAANALALVIASGIHAAAVLAQFILLKRGYDDGEVGSYALYLAMLTPVFLLAAFQQRRIITTAKSGIENTPLDHITLFGVAHAATWAIVVCWCCFLSGMRWELLTAIMIGRTVENAREASFGALQRNHQFHWIAAIRIISSATLVGSTVIASHVFEFPLPRVILVCALCQSIAYTFFEFPLLLKFGSIAASHVSTENATDLSNDRLSRLALFRFGGQLGGTAYLASLMGNAPVYLLAWSGYSGMIATFALLSRLALLGALVTRAINETVSGPLAMLWSSNRTRACGRLLARTAGIDIAVGCSVLLVTQALFGPLATLLDVDRSPYGRLLFTLVIVTMVINNLIGLSNVALATMRTGGRMVMQQVLSLLLMFTVGAYLISTLGLTGALIATGVCKLPSLVLAKNAISRRLAERSVDDEQPNARYDDSINPAASAA